MGIVKTEIYRIPLGMCNCYLIKQEGLILIDAGFPKQGPKFLKELRQLAIEPRDISLLMLTHGHYDHIGSLAEVKRLTGGKVAVNRREKDWVEQALKPLPPAVGLWGEIWTVVMKMMVSRMSFPGTVVDITLEDNEFSLETYGIHGRAIHTPGHSSGSMSVLLDTGDAFVGDMAMNGFPLRIGPGLPIFAEDMGALKASWGTLLARGIKTVYPAHGKPFDAEVMKKLLSQNAT